MSAEPMRKKDGHTVLYVKGGGSYDADASEYECLSAEILCSGTWLHFTGFYGDQMRLLRASVEAIGLETQDSIAARRIDSIMSEREHNQRVKEDATAHGVFDP